MLKMVGFDDGVVDFTIFGKDITLGTPHRVELILIFFYAGFLGWWDVVQNKVLDFGVGYQVSLIPSITFSALDFSIILLMLFHLTLMGLFLMSLRSHATSKVLDVIVGTLAFFGVAIVLSGFINSLYSETIRFLFINMGSVSFYHIGIAIEAFAGTYWAFTK